MKKRYYIYKVQEITEKGTIIFLQHCESNSLYYTRKIAKELSVFKCSSDFVVQQHDQNKITEYTLSNFIKAKQ
jgi:hypothetical protein